MKTAWLKLNVLLRSPIYFDDIIEHGRATQIPIRTLRLYDVYTYFGLADFRFVMALIHFLLFHLFVVFIF